MTATATANKAYHPLPINPAAHVQSNSQSESERLQRQKPCRTLFVRNISYNADPLSVRTPFESYGELADFFDLIEKRGMCFITYFDLRSAENAFNAMQGSQIQSRPLDVHYSLPKADETQQPCERGKHQGTLSAWLESASEPINDSEFYNLLSEFGEIKEIRPYDDRDDSRYVEFFDSRAAISAFDNLNGSDFQSGKLNLYFEWDCPMLAAPSRSGGYANLIAPEQDIDKPARDFSNNADPNAKNPLQKRRRGGRRQQRNEKRSKWHKDRDPRGNDAPLGENSESNIRNAYSNRVNNHYQQPYGGYKAPASTSTPYAYGSQHNTDQTARLADAQRVQALLSSLNPNTLNMAAAATPTPAPAPIPVPPPTAPMMAAPMMPQPVPTPYFASRSPPTQQPQSSLPANVMSLLQAASSNVNNSSGYPSGYQAMPSYNSYQPMPSVPSLPSMPPPPPAQPTLPAARDPRVAQQQTAPVPAPAPSASPQDAPNPQSVQALLSMLNNQ
ncbi:hypothetical protein E3Q06_02420 [Wallemia mellicola]|nr:hypothetical protein E3Q24_02157 [Wallemia mellicola]TIB84316.1 hypothetical protein E3Q21_02433 [Wallemia mellicola]TIB87532.1 hypothetical protein E3Q20_02439 [Wallemia mellicola]TIC16944.1 hypothetical protein E3Q13_02694 [Wallemia mellicola]TIC39981.1 hypothetical protein E3Q07_02455 [Wallemia mellicola]